MYIIITRLKVLEETTNILTQVAVEQLYWVDKASPALKVALCDGLPSDTLLASLCKVLGQRAIRFTMADVDQPSKPAIWGEVNRQGSKTPAYILQAVDRVGYGDMEQDEHLLSVQAFIRNEEFNLGLRDFA